MEPVGHRPPNWLYLGQPGLCPAGRGKIPPGGEGLRGTTASRGKVTQGGGYVLPEPLQILFANLKNQAQNGC